MIYPLDGAGGARPVPEVTDSELTIQWSADSRSLFFLRTSERPVRIWRVDVASGQRALWKELPVDSLTSGWRVRVRMTPDGQSYVYGFTDVLSELYLVEGLR